MNNTEEQSKAYTEVLEVLKYMPIEEVSKIPKDIIDFYNNNKDTTYEFRIDVNKTFEEQVLLEKTKIILAILYRDYWATETQRDKIKKKEIYDLQQIEREKSEKFNGNEIFAKKKENSSVPSEETALVEYKKDNWFKKLIEFMKKFFNKN